MAERCTGAGRLAGAGVGQRAGGSGAGARAALTAHTRRDLPLLLLPCLLLSLLFLFELTLIKRYLGIDALRENGDDSLWQNWRLPAGAELWGASVGGKSARGKSMHVFMQACGTESGGKWGDGSRDDKS